MTSRIINFIAEKYLANIVEINPEKTKSSLWSGVFEMSNLKIKKEIFDSLNMPYFELINGYIGKLKIELSLPRFYSNPIKIEIDKVFFLSRHKSLDKLNKEVEQLSMENYKNAKLLSAEQFTTEINKINSESSSFLSNIINNIQITINDICIRIDDFISSPSTPFSLGLLLKKVIIQTTTDQYKESSNPEQIPFAVINYKLIKISNLSIFLDMYTNIEDMNFTNEIIKSNETIIDNQLKNYLGELCDFYQYGLTETLIKFQDPKAHNYLLFDLVMNLRIALNEDVSNGKPKLKAKCAFNKIQMGISLKQIKVIMQLLAYIDLNSLYELGIRKSYYLKSLTKEEKRDYMNNYINYYTAKYDKDEDGRGEKVNQLKKNLELIEERLTYEKIQSMRDACLIKIKYINSIKEIDKEIADLEKVSWNPLTYLMTNKTEKEEQIKQLKNKKNSLTLQANDIESEIQKKIQTPIIPQDIANDNKINALKDEFVLYHIKLSFTEIKLAIFELGSTQPLLIIQQKRLEILTDIRKEGQFYSLYIGDIIISQEKLRNTLYRNLFATIDSIDKYYEDIDINATLPLYKKAPNYNNGALYIEFETSTLLPNSNYRLKFRNDKQLLITVNLFSLTYSINKILDALNATISLEDIQKYTAGEVTKYVQEGYVENFLSGNYQHFNIDLDIIFNGPIVLIPQNILDINNNKCLIIRLGDLSVKSKLPPKQNLKDIDFIHLNDPKDLYDVYIFEASNFNLSTLVNYDGNISHISKALKYDIIEEISVAITLSSIIEPKNIHFPNIDLQININSIQINIKDIQFFFFIEFIDAIEKTNKYLQTFLKVNQHKQVNQSQTKAESEIPPNINNPIKDSSNTNNKELVINKKEVLQRESEFFKMTFNLHSIKLLIQKTIPKDERELMKDKDEFKHFISFCIKQLDINLSITEKKNTSLSLTLFTICITDEETKYDEETKQVKLISNPAFICILSTRHTNITEILRNNTRGNMLLLSLLGKTPLFKEDITNTPFAIINYQYDSNIALSTISIEMSNLKMNVNLSAMIRLYQFLLYFYDEYSKMLIMHIDDQANNSNDLIEEYNKFEEINQLKTKMLPKEGINQDFMSRLKNKAIKHNEEDDNINNYSSKFNKVKEDEAINKTENLTNCTKEKSYVNILFSLYLNEVEFIFPLYPEEPNTKLLKFNFSLISKTDIQNEYESLYSNKTKMQIRINYLKKNIKFSAKLYHIAFDILSYSNEKFRSNCLSEKILNNLRIILQYHSFLLLVEEKNVSVIKLAIEPMAIMIGFREVEVFKSLLKQFDIFQSKMNEKYNDPITTLNEESPSFLFNNCKIDNGLQNLLRNKAKVMKLKALKTILQEETKDISNKIDQNALINITSFNNVLDINSNLERVTLRFMDNTLNYEASVFHIELNQLEIRYISNSEPNDVLNMANAIVESIGGKEIPFNQYNWYSLLLYFNASMKFAISFFNNNTNNWEPIIEPWSLILKTIQVAKFTRLKTEVTSDSILNCNLSLYSVIVFNSFMQKINQREEDWFQESRNASFNSQKGDDSAVEFSNITGITLTFWLDCNPSIKYILKNKEKKIFTKNDIFKSNIKRIDTESQFIKKDKFSFKLEGFCEIYHQDYSFCHFSNLIIDEDDNKTKREEKKRIQMTIRIKSRGMVKSILFESNIALFNNLTYPVMLVMIKTSDYLNKYEGNDDQIDHEKEINEIVVPNKKCVIPLSYIIDDYRIYIGIVQNSQKNKCQLFIGDFSFLNEYHQEMTAFYNSSDNSKPVIRDSISKILQFPYENRIHYVSVDSLVQKSKSDIIPQRQIPKDKLNKEEAKDEEEKSFFTKTFSYFIVLQKPLVLENQLPFLMILSLNSIDQVTKKKTIQLNPLDIVSMHSLDPTESETEVILSLHYNNSIYHSNSFFLFDKAIDKGRILNLKRDDGQCINISIDIASNDIDLNMYNSSRLELIKVFSHRMKIVFYFEYIVVNKTLLTLYGKDEAHLINRNLPGINGTFYPLSVTAFNISVEKISIREGNTDWCKPFELKTFGMAGVCTLETKKGKYTHMLEISVLISSSEKFTYSTIITLEDRYLIMNELEISISFRQYIDKKTYFSSISLNSNDKKTVSFIRTSKKMKKCLQVSLNSQSYSSPFFIDKLDDVNIKLPIDDNFEKLLRHNQEASKSIFALNGKKFILIKVTIHSIDNGLIYIVLHYPQYSDYKIRNEIASQVQILQKNDDFNKEYFDMNPNEEVLYAWDDLLKKDKILVCIIKGTVIEVAFNKIELIPIKIEGKHYYLDVSLENDNMTRVLTIKEVLFSKEETTAMKILLGKKKAINCKVQFNLKGIGISVIDDFPKEVLYLSISGFDIKYSRHINKTNKTIETTDNVILNLMSIQIDYCLLDNSFKSLLIPKSMTVFNDSDYESHIPFLQSVLSRRLIFNIESEKYITTYPQATITLQDVNLFLDQKSLMIVFKLWEELLSKLDFYQPKKEYVRMASITEHNNQLNKVLSFDKYDPILSTSSETAKAIIDKTYYTNMLFINYFMISSLRLIMSLRIDLREFGTDFGLPRWLFKIVVAIGNSLGHIDNAPIIFRQLINKNTFTNWSKILSVLIQTYQGQIFEQIYTIIGYSNLLGNPMGRMEKFGSNVKKSKNKDSPSNRKMNQYNQPLSKNQTNNNDNIMKREEPLTVQISNANKENQDSNIEYQYHNNLQINKEEPLKLIINSKPNNQGLIKFLSKEKTSTSLKEVNKINFQNSNIPLGIRDQTINISNEAMSSIRVRFPRIIDTVKGLQPYDPSRAGKYALLKSIWDHDVDYKILYYKDMIYFEDGYDKKISTIILTDSHVLIIYNLIKIVFKAQLHKILKVEVHLVNTLYIFLLIMTNSEKRCFKTNDLILCCELYSLLSKIINSELSEQ